MEEQKENMNFNNLINNTKLQVGDIIDVLRIDTNERESYSVGSPFDIQGIMNDITNGKIKIINVRRPILESRAEIVEELISIQNTKPAEPVINEYEIYCLTDMINSIIEFGMADLKRDDLEIIITKMSQPNNNDEIVQNEIMIQIKTKERVLLFQIMKESLRLNFAKLEMGTALTIEDVFKNCNVVVTPEGYLNYAHESKIKSEEKINTIQSPNEEGSNTADELIIS